MRKPIGKLKDANKARTLRRKLSIRQKLSGTSERPRISINRSNKNIRVQVIDDEAGKTLFSVQTYGKSAVSAKANKEGAKLVGTKVAEGLKSKSLGKAVFDRNGLQYHGVISELATAIRENGIQI